jgi:hypothetical protein
MYFAVGCILIGSAAVVAYQTHGLRPNIPILLLAALGILLWPFVLFIGMVAVQGWMIYWILSRLSGSTGAGVLMTIIVYLFMGTPMLVLTLMVWWLVLTLLGFFV